MTTRSFYVNLMNRPRGGVMAQLLAVQLVWGSPLKEISPTEGQNDNC